ncbi:MAG: SPOR domain-containing protein [Firmicutes bacterium]|nr:SPOR domain-containing protein [Bacillota bacterium]
MRQELNFIVTLVTISLIFVFVGYLSGHYVAEIFWARQKSKLEFAAEQEAAAPAAGFASNTPLESQPVLEQKEKSPPPPTLYRVQVGVFSEKANADRLVALLKEKGYEVIRTLEAPYRVQTGAFSSLENANQLAARLREEGFEAIVIR